MTNSIANAILRGMINFKEYFIGLTVDEKKVLAKDADTSTAYLSQIAYGHRNAGAKPIEALVKSGRKDVVKMLRPGLYSAVA